MQEICRITGRSGFPGDPQPIGADGVDWQLIGYLAYNSKERGDECVFYSMRQDVPTEQRTFTARQLAALKHSYEKGFLYGNDIGISLYPYRFLPAPTFLIEYKCADGGIYVAEVQGIFAGGLACISRYRLLKSMRDGSQPAKPVTPSDTMTIVVAADDRNFSAFVVWLDSEANVHSWNFVSAALHDAKQFRRYQRVMDNVVHYFAVESLDAFKADLDDYAT